MTRMAQKQTAILIGVALFLLGVDQWTKVWAREHLALVPCNDGIALSMPLPMIVTIAISAIILTALIVWFVRHRRHALSERLGLVLVIAGGIGNFIDRIAFGCVTDFVTFFDLWHFNVADAMIAGGVAVIMWHMIVIAPRQSEDFLAE